jgi:hypothetical protein
MSKPSIIHVCHTSLATLLLEISLGCVQYYRETKYQWMEIKFISETLRVLLANGEDQNGVYHSL